MQCGTEARIRKLVKNYVVSNEAEPVEIRCRNQRTGRVDLIEGGPLAPIYPDETCMRLGKNWKAR